MAKPNLSVALLFVAFWTPCVVRVHAGAIYQTKPVYPTRADDYKVAWNVSLSLPGLPGMLYGPVTAFNATAFPQIIARLNRCAVANFHYHPWATEQIFVIAGSIEMGLFSEDLVLRLVRANTSEGVIVPQGTAHYIRNTANDTTILLSTFDQQNFGTILIPNAVVATPLNVQSGFFDGFPPAGVNSPIFTLANCTVS